MNSKKYFRRKELAATISLLLASYPAYAEDQAQDSSDQSGAEQTEELVDPNTVVVNRQVTQESALDGPPAMPTKTGGNGFGIRDAIVVGLPALGLICLTRPLTGFATDPHLCVLS